VASLLKDMDAGDLSSNTAALLGIRHSEFEFEKQPGEIRHDLDGFKEYQLLLRPIVVERALVGLIVCKDSVRFNKRDGAHAFFLGLVGGPRTAQLVDPHSGRVNPTVVTEVDDHVALIRRGVVDSLVRRVTGVKSWNQTAVNISGHKRDPRYERVERVGNLVAVQGSPFGDYVAGYDTASWQLEISTSGDSLVAYYCWYKNTRPRRKGATEIGVINFGARKGTILTVDILRHWMIQRLDAVYPRSLQTAADHFTLPETTLIKIMLGEEFVDDATAMRKWWWTNRKTFDPLGEHPVSDWTHQ
jgi:hypothetical protein